LVRGMKLGDGSTVVAVMKTLCLDGAADLVKLPGGLMITPFHPVIASGGKWTFPYELAASSKTSCDAIFSFLLMGKNGKYSSSINVCGIECITLSHGIQNDPVASHAFFGTSKVVESLMESKGFYATDGVVTLDQAYSLGTMVRDSKTHLVCGLVINDKVMEESNQVKDEARNQNLSIDSLVLSSQ